MGGDNTYNDIVLIPEEDVSIRMLIIDKGISKLYKRFKIIDQMKNNYGILLNIDHIN